MDLGSQTVKVIARVRLKRGMTDEQPAGTFPGCSVQPVGSEDGVPLEQNERWRIFAPPGFPKSTDNVLEVDGIPGRLHVDGNLQDWIDDDGIVDHVHGFLERWKDTRDGQ